jgi:arsenite oxidase small subunit
MDTEDQVIRLNDQGAAHGSGPLPCMSRRNFLLTGGAVVSVVALGGVPGLVGAATPPLQAIRATYPRQRIGKLSALQRGKPVNFKYPYPNVENMLVRLGVPAGGGVGTGQDVVAFNLQCTHMGGPLHGTYKDEHQMLGPCPLHLTTFDLTRHGMVVAGHGTESLPQIVLETAGDDIYAVGVLGLIYGYAHNVTDVQRG